MDPTIEMLNKQSQELVKAWGHPALARIVVILACPSWRDGQPYLDEDDIEDIFEQVKALRDVLTDAEEATS